MGKTAFFFSHIPQIKWFSVFAEGFKEMEEGNRNVLFVHGEEEKEFAKKFDVYDEVVDMIEGFIFDDSKNIDDVLVSSKISELEKQCKTNFFWEDLKIDRWARAKNNRSFLIQYMNHASSIIFDKVDQYNPIFGYGESTMAIYRMAHHKFDSLNRKYIGATSTRYFKRFYIEDDWFWRWDKCLEKYSEYLENGVPLELKEQVEPVFNRIAIDNRKPMHFENFSEKHSKGYIDLKSHKADEYIQKVKDLVKVKSSSELENNIRYSIIEKSFLTKVKRHLKNKKWHKEYLELVEKELPKNVKYSSYYLHFQPEYTADSLGKFYTNQNFLIRNIASALPADQLLVVKDHPSMIGLRDPSFYEDIKKNSNVILIHHDCNSMDIIKQSQIVFSIVGTSALEAMFVGVPSILFGKYAFANTNLIKLCADFWELPQLINKQLENQPSPDEVKRHAVALLAAKYSASFEGQLPLESDGIDAFYDDKSEYNKVKMAFSSYIKEEVL